MPSIASDAVSFRDDYDDCFSLIDDDFARCGRRRRQNTPVKLRVAARSLEQPPLALTLHYRADTPLLPLLDDGESE